MKPENILQSDLLDIIFEDRNKAYGAYDLRKQYNRRLSKALAVTLLMVLSFAVSEYIRANYFKGNISIVAGQPTTEVHLEDAKNTVKPKEKPLEPKTEKAKPKASQAYTNPLIVPDNKVTKEVPAIEALATKAISKETTEGEEVAPSEVALPKDNGTGAGAIVATQKEEEPEIKGPLTFAEVMPEFPGGMEAFRKFMLKNLRQAEDLEGGQKVVVRVRFIVGADGSLQDAHIEQSGGELDKEVLRVLSRMPHWKPGVQNGRNVAVYFSLPVTFMGAE